MTNNKEKILNSIAAKTSKEKPIQMSVIIAFRLGVIALCIAVLGIAVFLIGLFTFDYFEKGAIEEFINQTIYTPSHFLYEYLIVALVFIVIFVYLYRKFDWPFAKEKNNIFLLSIIFSLVFGFAFASLAEHYVSLREGLETVKDTYVNHMPIRKAQRSATNAVLKASSAVIGTISKVSEDQEQIVITLTMKTGEQVYTGKESVVTEALRVGEKVVLRLDIDQKTITKLKVIK